MKKVQRGAGTRDRKETHLVIDTRMENFYFTGTNFSYIRQTGKMSEEGSSAANVIAKNDARVITRLKLQEYFGKCS